MKRRADSKPKELGTYTKKELMTFSTELVNRASLAARLGYQYGGDRNIYEALGYPTYIAYQDYAARYARQDIARAVINRPIAFTWKGPLVITEVGVEEDTPLEKAWVELEKNLKLKSKFVRVDKLASVGCYGALLLGFGDTGDKEGWSQPITNGKQQLNYVKPLGQGHAQIATYVSKPSDPRFGMVEMYDITITNPGGDSTDTFVAHWSRVLHITGELLESEVEGVPVMVRLTRITVSPAATAPPLVLVILAMTALVALPLFWVKVMAKSLAATAPLPPLVL